MTTRVVVGICWMAGVAAFGWGCGDETEASTGGTSASASGGGGPVDASSAQAAGGTSSSSSSGGGATTSSSSSSSGGGGGGGPTTSSAATGGGGPVDCDYQVENGLMVIEAEDLPLADSWQIAADETGFTGSGYIVWTGASQNNSPGQGLISVDVHVPVVGRYRWRWRNRIGMGDDPTEHNDTWLRWPTLDARDFYGMRVQDGIESRRYPKPTCDDGVLMDMITTELGLGSAQCPNGATTDGWLKIYSSGATDWSWSTRTSDNDAHDIFIDVDAPGVFRFEMSARGDYHLLDRLVLSEESVPSPEAEDLAAVPTPCN